jgi:hypothetical protein
MEGRLSLGKGCRPAQHPKLAHPIAWSACARSLPAMARHAGALRRYTESLVVYAAEQRTTPVIPRQEATR